MGFNDPIGGIGGSVERTGNTTMILLLGDSNTGTAFRDAPASDVNVKEWETTTQTLVTASDPLEHINWAAAEVGCAVFLGKNISAQTGNDVVIVPAGQGGSGFQNDNWKTGGSLYLEAVDRFNDAYAAATNVNKILILLSLGINNVGTSDYAAQLDSLVTRLRTDLNRNLKFNACIFNQC